MKNLFKTVLIICTLIFSLTSCENEELVADSDLLSLEERVENLNKLKNSLFEYKKFSKNNKLASKSNSISFKEQKLIGTVVENSKNIFDYLGIDEEDLKNISKESGENVNTDDIYVAFGLALISSYNNADNSNTASKALNISYMRKGDFGDCLMEATGLNALVA